MATGKESCVSPWRMARQLCKSTATGQDSYANPWLLGKLFLRQLCKSMAIGQDNFVNPWLMDKTVVYKSMATGQDSCVSHGYWTRQLYISPCNGARELCKSTVTG